MTKLSLNFLWKYQMGRHKINISTKLSILLNQVPNFSGYDTLNTILAIYSLFYLTFSTSSCGLNMATYSWSYSSPMWPWYKYSSHRMNFILCTEGYKISERVHESSSSSSCKSSLWAGLSFWLFAKKQQTCGFRIRHCPFSKHPKLHNYPDSHPSRYNLF